MLSKNIKFIYKSLDYYRNIYYNKSEFVSNDILWLLLIRSKNFHEVGSIARLLMSNDELKVWNVVLNKVRLI